MSSSKILFFYILSIIVGYSPKLEASHTAGRSPVTIMTFNVENLFDTEHDSGKDDYTYLPIEQKKNKNHQAKCQKQHSAFYRNECLYLDWSESKLAEKLRRVAQTVLQVNSGQGPDVLVLEEIENRSLLERLSHEFLGKAKYVTSVLIRSRDSRGINVGILSRLELAEKPSLYHLEKPYHTRGILRADLKLPFDSGILTVLGAHFPSISHPVSERAAAFDTLLEIKNSLPETSFVIAAGDLNVAADEEETVGHFAKQSKNWLISHWVGCHNDLGTHYYSAARNPWSFLDVLMFSKNLAPKAKSRWALDYKSIRVIKGYTAQRKPDGTPARFRSVENPLGVSDHFPLAAQLIMQADLSASP